MYGRNWSLFATRKWHCCSFMDNPYSHILTLTQFDFSYFLGAKRNCLELKFRWVKTFFNYAVALLAFSQVERIGCRPTLKKWKGNMAFWNVFRIQKRSPLQLFELREKKLYSGLGWNYQTRMKISLEAGEKKLRSDHILKLLLEYSLCLVFRKCLQDKICRSLW